MLFSVMTLILRVTLGYLPTSLLGAGFSVTTRARTKTRSPQKGAPCVWNKPGSPLPSRHCRWRHGVASEGWPASWLEVPALTFCLSPLASPQTPPPSCFSVLVSFTASSANLPVLFDSGIFSCPCPQPPELGEG